MADSPAKASIVFRNPLTPTPQEQEHARQLLAVRQREAALRYLLREAATPRWWTALMAPSEETAGRRAEMVGLRIPGDVYVLAILREQNPDQPALDAEQRAFAASQTEVVGARKRRLSETPRVGAAL